MAPEEDTDARELLAQLDDLARIVTCRQELDGLLLEALTAGGLAVPQMARISRFASTRMPGATLAWDRAQARISGEDTWC